MRPLVLGCALAGLILAASASHAAGIDDLKGRFAFNWATDPNTVQCAAIDDALLAEFKSDKFRCELTPVTNTGSGQPAQVCTEAGGGREFLVFETMAACEDERAAQSSAE